VVDLSEVNPDAPAITIENSETAVATITAPVVSSTQTVDLILEVTDTGNPPITRYQRALLTITP
jgi:hypothetical protein